MKIKNYKITPNYTGITKLGALLTILSGLAALGGIHIKIFGDSYVPNNAPPSTVNTALWYIITGFSDLLFLLWVIATLALVTIVLVDIERLEAQR